MVVVCSHFGSRRGLWSLIFRSASLLYYRLIDILLGSLAIMLRSTSLPRVVLAVATDAKLLTFSGSAGGLVRPSGGKGDTVRRSGLSLVFSPSLLPFLIHRQRRVALQASAACLLLALVAWVWRRLRELSARRRQAKVDLTLAGFEGFAGHAYSEKAAASGIGGGGASSDSVSQTDLQVASVVPGLLEACRDAKLPASIRNRLLHRFCSSSPGMPVSGALLPTAMSVLCGTEFFEAFMRSWRQRLLEAEEKGLEAQRLREALSEQESSGGAKSVVVLSVEILGAFGPLPPSCSTSPKKGCKNVDMDDGGMHYWYAVTCVEEAEDGGVPGTTETVKKSRPVTVQRSRPSSGRSAEEIEVHSLADSQELSVVWDESAMSFNLRGDPVRAGCRIAVFRCGELQRRDHLRTCATLASEQECNIGKDFGDGRGISDPECLGIFSYPVSELLRMEGRRESLVAELLAEDEEDSVVDEEGFADARSEGTSSNIRVHLDLRLSWVDSCGGGQKKEASSLEKNSAIGTRENGNCHNSQVKIGVGAGVASSSLTTAPAVGAVERLSSPRSLLYRMRSLEAAEQLLAAADSSSSSPGEVEEDKEGYDDVGLWVNTRLQLRMGLLRALRGLQLDEAMEDRAQQVVEGLEAHLRGGPSTKFPDGVPGFVAPTLAGRRYG